MILGNREIALSLFAVGHSPSLDRQIVFVIFPASKKAPLVAHLLNSTVIVVRYSIGNFLRIKAELLVLSLDFLGRNFFHSRRTSSNFICSSEIAGKYDKLSKISIAIRCDLLSISC